MYFLIAAVASVALNAFPLTSIILLLFMGPYWPGLFATLAMVSMAFEVVLGLIPRPYLIGPLMWIGFGVLGHLDARGLAREIDRETVTYNTQARENLGAAGRSLTLIQNGHGGGIGAAQFLRRYDLDTVYELNADTPSAAWSIVSRPYGSPMSESGFGRNSVRYYGVVEGKDLLSGISEKREEIAKVPRDTTMELIESKRIDRRGLVGDLRQYRLTANGKSAVVRSGSVAGPGWFLFPVFGCFPNGGTWKCEGKWTAETQFSVGRGDGTGSDTDVIAEALGLQRSGIRDRFPDVLSCREVRARSIVAGAPRSC